MSPIWPPYAAAIFYGGQPIRHRPPRLIKPANRGALSPRIAWRQKMLGASIIGWRRDKVTRAVFETWDTQKRVAEAKRLTERLVDHTQYLLDIHENNTIVLYSDTLSKQIPKSYAANAFNVFREAMHQIEVIRICALWDSADKDKESILTVIELIDDPKVLDALADQARAGHPKEIGEQQAERGISSLKGAIKQARELRKSARLKSIRNLRDKHVAHYLTQTREETKSGPVEQMKHGDEVPVLDATISIVEALNSWVNDVSLPLKESQAIDRKCAQALWQTCTFKIDPSPATTKPAA